MTKDGSGRKIFRARASLAGPAEAMPCRHSRSALPGCRAPIFPLRGAGRLSSFRLPTLAPAAAPGPNFGVIAQLVERYNGIVEVCGSIPHGSTIFFKGFEAFRFGPFFFLG